MKFIKDVLSQEIYDGYVNWDMTSEKIHAALNAVDNKFEYLRNDGEKTHIKFQDSLTLKVRLKNEILCYKIIKPRFINGELLCAGMQYGRYDLKGVPYFFSPPEIF